MEFLAELLLTFSATTVLDVFAGAQAAALAAMELSIETGKVIEYHGQYMRSLTCH